MKTLTLAEKAELGRQKARRARVERESVADGKPVSTKTFSTKLSAESLTNQLIAIWPKWLDWHDTRYGRKECLDCRCWRVEGDEVRGPRSLGLWNPVLVKLPKHTWHIGRIRKERGYFFEKASEAEWKRVLALLPERGV
jgi:hypothetical protein